MYAGNSVGVVTQPAKPRPKPPPQDGDEWLAREGLAEIFPEIPNSFLGQHKIDYHADTLVGNEEEIAESLREKSALDFTDLERLAANIDELIDQINALHILTGPSKAKGARSRAVLGPGESPREPSVALERGLWHAPRSQDSALLGIAQEDRDTAHDTTTAVDTADTVTTYAPPADRGRPVRRRGRNGEQSRGIASVQYPGFDATEATSLPVVVEPAELLSEPVSHLNVTDGFKRKWRQVMTNDMSILLLQDTFWWLFLEHFSPDGGNQDLLFSRIADTFVWMLDSPSLADYRDDLFQLFPHCLSQAMLYTFCRMFPSSLGLFDDEFRTELANTIWQWISGITCPPQFHWSTWPLPKLGVCRTLAAIPSGSAMAAYTRTLENLRLVPLPAQRKTLTHRTSQSHVKGSARLSATVRSVASASQRRSSARPTSMLRKRTAFGDAQDDCARPSSAPLSIAEHVAHQLCVSDLKSAREQNMKKGKAKAKSHTISSDAEYRRVVFDMKGRSPLVEHFLACHRNVEKTTNMMTRAEMEPDRDADAKPTFSDALAQTREFGRRLEERYEQAVREQADRALALQEEFAVTKQIIDRDANDKCREIMRRRRIPTQQQLDKMDSQPGV